MIALHPMLTYERLEPSASELNSLGSSSIWGSIDGTVRNMCRPTRHQERCYSGYKKKHGFKYQGIVTPDGMIVSCMGPFEGRLNDVNMFVLTEMKKRFQELYQGRTPLFLYRDSPYDSCYRVIAPYKGTCPLPRQQISFNAALSSDRISVEQAFGCVTQLWHANNLNTNLKPILQPVALHYEISALFTNIHICLRGNVVSHRYNIPPPSLDE
jgi:DDE superfamily endonuclease